MWEREKKGIYKGISYNLCGATALICKLHDHNRFQTNVGETAEKCQLFSFFRETQNARKQIRKKTVQDNHISTSTRGKWTTYQISVTLPSIYYMLIT
jgi:hypothetical protein